MCTSTCGDVAVRCDASVLQSTKTLALKLEMLALFEATTEHQKTHRPPPSRQARCWPALVVGIVYTLFTRVSRPHTLNPKLLRKPSTPNSSKTLHPKSYILKPNPQNLHPTP